MSIDAVKKLFQVLNIFDSEKKSMLLLCNILSLNYPCQLMLRAYISAPFYFTFSRNLN